MSKGIHNQQRDASPHRELYSVGYGASAHAWHTARTAANRASFFLPHLRPGMSVLDCGCGPGTITAGLAEVVEPGTVTGIDLEPEQIERARSLAAERGLDNLRFEVGDIYRLRFPDATFDAVFAHNVLEHLRDPLQALREMRRVLKPGGLIGVRDPDYGSGLWEPSTPLLRETSELLLRIREHNGGSPYYARHQRRLLLEAGFARSEGFAFAEYQGNPEVIRAYVKVLVEVLRGPATVDVSTAQGWADQTTLDAMVAAAEAWGDRPDAFRALLDCAAIGWAGE